MPIEAERFRSSRPTSTAARSGSPVIEAQSGRRGLRPIALARAIPAVRRPRRRTNQPGDAAIPHQASLQTRRPRRAGRPWCARARTAPYLRHRARELGRERLYVDEIARPRIHDNLAAVRRCIGHRNTQRRSTKSAVRNDLSRESQPRSGVLMQPGSRRDDDFPAGPDERYVVSRCFGGHQLGH